MYVTQVLLFFTISLLTVAFLWLKHRKTYWKRNNVPHIASGSIIWGNLKKTIFLEENVAYEMNKFYYDEKTKDSPYVGFYSIHKPMLMLKDPEVIKNILVKDFNFFSDR